jgi:subtilisin family serine protease
VTTNALLLPSLSFPDGTHVAGTIGGSVFGVAKNANLHCIKVMNDDGTGSTSTIISGINAAARQALASTNPSVISMSLGGPPNRSIDNAVCFLPVNY